MDNGPFGEDVNGSLMRTMYVDVSIPRIALTRVLGRISRGAHFAPTSPLRLANLPDPPLPDDSWVRVRNSMCGICGSDLHQIFVDTALDVAPVALPAHRRIYLGHEMVGEIVEKGSAVTGMSAGDRVVRWGRMDDCLSRGEERLCPPCSRGHRVLCELASEPREHYPVGGGFGDSFISPAAALVPVLPDLADEQAIFTEPAAVAVHAANRCPPQPADRVLVVGVGTIGFLLLQVLRLLQPDCEITAVAQFAWQAETARRFGADHVFMSGEDNYANSAQKTGARLYQGRRANRMLIGGFDIVFDVVGIPQTINDALRWTRANGTVVIVGVHLHRMQLDLTPVWHQEVNLIGAVGHDIVDWQGKAISTFDLAQQWMAEGKIESDALLTHTFALDDYRRAIDTALDKATSRSVKVAFDYR
ncbi:MAG: zinc-binding dehydrogenase [Candidatus Promineifilaceae bacterium]